MIVKVYSIYDSKAKAYLQPFHAPNAAVATRMVSDAVQDTQHMFYKHSADYTLFEIAEFDDSTGMFISNSAPENLGCLVSYKPVNDDRYERVSHV